MKDNIFVIVRCDGLEGKKCRKPIAFVGTLFGKLIITDNHGHSYEAPTPWAFLEECPSNHATRPMHFHPEGQRLRPFPWSAVESAYERSRGNGAIEEVRWGQADVEAAARQYASEFLSR